VHSCVRINNVTAPNAAMIAIIPRIAVARILVTLGCALLYLRIKRKEGKQIVSGSEDGTGYMLPHRSNQLSPSIVCQRLNNFSDLTWAIVFLNSYVYKETSIWCKI
jgi:hypothetical protein